MENLNWPQKIHVTDRKTLRETKMEDQSKKLKLSKLGKYRRLPD